MSLGKEPSIYQKLKKRCTVKLKGLTSTNMGSIFGILNANPSKNTDAASLGTKRGGPVTPNLPTGGAPSTGEKDNDKLIIKGKGPKEY